jgi:hypothetical protein
MPKSIWSRLTSILGFFTIFMLKYRGHAVNFLFPKTILYCNFLPLTNSRADLLDNFFGAIFLYAEFIDNR